MAAVAVVPVQQAVVSPFDSEIVEGQVFEQHVDVMLFLSLIHISGFRR